MKTYTEKEVVKLLADFGTHVAEQCTGKKLEIAGELMKWWKLNIPAVSTSTFMKERRGYKRELLGTRYDGWTERTEYKWQYTWSDGTKSIKYTYR